MPFVGIETWRNLGDAKEIILLHLSLQTRLLKYFIVKIPSKHFCDHWSCNIVFTLLGLCWVIETITFNIQCLGATFWWCYVRTLSWISLETTLKHVGTRVYLGTMLRNGKERFIRPFVSGILPRMRFMITLSRLTQTHTHGLEILALLVAKGEEIVG